MPKTLDTILNSCKQLVLGFSLAIQLGCQPSRELIQPALLPYSSRSAQREDALNSLRNYFHQLCDDSVVTPKLLYCKNPSNFIYHVSDIQNVSIYQPGLNYPWYVNIRLKGATVWRSLFAAPSRKEALKIALPLAVLVGNHYKTNSR